MERFELVSEYKPTGDQPQAIDKISERILAGERSQTLMGCHRIRQDFYYGKYHRARTETDSGDIP